MNGWSNWWIEADICKRFSVNKMLSSEVACQLRTDRETGSDGLLCLFVFSLLSALILFISFLWHLFSHIPLFLALILQTQFLFYSVCCQVAELKSELKRRTLPVSGTKTNLIERLRIYQELNGGADTTSSPTAGGTAGPGAGGAGKSTEGAASTANNNHASQQPQQQHQFQCHQISSFSGQSDGSQTGKIRKKTIYFITFVLPALSHITISFPVGTAEVGSATLAAGTPQQPMTSGGTTSPPTISLTHSDHLKDTVGPEDTSFDSDPSEQMVWIILLLLQ